MKFALVVASALIALSCVDAHGFEHLKAKLRHRFDIGGRSAYGGAVASNGGHGDYGGSAASAAAAASGASRGGYGGSSAAASAAAGASGYGAYPAPAYPEYESPHLYGTPPVVRAPHPAPRFRSYSPAYGGSASAAAAASTNVGVAAPAPPVRPVVNTNAFRGENIALHHAPVANRYTVRRPVAYGGGAASAAASAAGSAGGVSSAASAASAGAGRVGGGVAGGAASQVLASSTGTYSNNDNGRESSSYKRSTENLQNHEDGHVDDNHYYNAQSYGKAEDEDMHEAFNKNDEDIEQTPTVYRSKKSGENYVMDFKKARRESGSGVLAKDKHSSAFNKNSKKFTENVDQAHAVAGNGFVEDHNHVTTHALDDEDEEIYDSDGFGHAPVYPARGGAAAASAAAAGASGLGGAASSAAAAAAANRSI